MAKLYGVENLKKLVDFGTELTKQVDDVLADNKVQLIELPKFLDEILLIPGVAKAWPQIKQEGGEIDEDERIELVAYVKEKFDLRNDEAEALIEDSLLHAVTTISLVDRWRRIRERKKVA